jgi:hypothetical protein
MMDYDPKEKLEHEDVSEVMNPVVNDEQTVIATIPLHHFTDDDPLEY